MDAHAAYLTMSEALRASGRPIVFSLCDWGTSRPWRWARNVGNLWRADADIMDAWDGVKPYQKGVVNILDDQVGLDSYAGPGHWNDPDMLEVGNGGLTENEDRAHFSLWAILAAPLIAGNDIATMTPRTRAILTNRDVIAVDQDPLGIAGRRVLMDGDGEVWARPLHDGSRAVVLLNRGSAPRRVLVSWQSLGYPADLLAQSRDLWTGKVSRPVRDGFSAFVAPHGVVMVKVARALPAQRSKGEQ